MHDAGAVGAIERAADLDRHLQRVVRRQRAGPREARGQRLAFEELEHEEVGAGLGSDVVERADVRMIERRHGVRLAVEAGAQLGVGGELRRQHLDRDRAIEPRIARAVDLAHPAGADRRDDLIRPESRAGCQGHQPAGLCARNATGAPPMEARPPYC